MSNRSVGDVQILSNMSGSINGCEWSNNCNLFSFDIEAFNEAIRRAKQIERANHELYLKIMRYGITDFREQYKQYMGVPTEDPSEKESE